MRPLSADHNIPVDDALPGPPSSPVAAPRSGRDLTEAQWHALSARRGPAAPAGGGHGGVAALYAPLLAASRFVLAQVGQSLDGRVATPCGDARAISGEAGLRHLHRCRALVDAVIVGVGTVTADDPALSVRLVRGDSPLRVVIDPHGRIPRDARVLRDGAPTLLIHAQDADVPDLGVERIALPARGGIAPADILSALAARGLHRVLVEGGARTIARFLEADRVDRLHVSVAPLIIGCGPSGIALAPIQRLAHARRPPTAVYDLGGDVVFDCDLRG